MFLFLELTRVTLRYKSSYDRRWVAFVPNTSSVHSVVLVERRHVTERQTPRAVAHTSHADISHMRRAIKKHSPSPTCLTFVFSAWSPKCSTSCDRTTTGPNLKSAVSALSILTIASSPDLPYFKPTRRRNIAS